MVRVLAHATALLAAIRLLFGAGAIIDPHFANDTTDPELGKPPKARRPLLVIASANDVAMLTDIALGRRVSVNIHLARGNAS